MMNRRMTFLLGVWVAFIALFTGVGCRGRKVEDHSVSGPEPVVDTRLRYNRVSDLASSLYQSQLASPVNWQPWSKETLQLARDSRRMLFVVVVMPQQPDFQKVLSFFESSPAVVATLNHEYVPVLVDADISREIGLLAVSLCNELQRPAQFPVCMWMTHDADPVAWVPMNHGSSREVLQVFDQSHGTVARMWQEDAAYMLKNSARDQQLREQRMAAQLGSIKASGDPGRDVVLALRELLALYDPYTKGFDQAGGLFPAGLLELLAVTSKHPGLQEDLKEKAGKVLVELLNELLPSAMFDPLDGGVYSSRRGGISWDFPSFVRNCGSQARIASSLVEAYHATGNALALDRALDAMAFVHGQYRNEEGLYVMGLQGALRMEDWMWTPEEIRKLLPASQADWWIRASGVKGLGNLPSEADPHREFFRCNTLSLPMSPLRISQENGKWGISLVEFEESRAVLRNSRLKKTRSLFRDRTAHLTSCLRVASAEASLFTATRDEAHRDRAVDLLRKVRAVFSDGRNLRCIPGSAADAVSIGRAFHYALAIQTSLDVLAITGDDEWLLWAEDLAAVSAEQFARDGHLFECPESAVVIDMPLADQAMWFDDSTAGLFAMAECRMASLGRPLMPRLAEVAGVWPESVAARPVSRTDLLSSGLMKNYRWSMVEGRAVPDELMAEIRRLPFRSMLREAADARRGVPDGEVEIRWHDGESSAIKTVDELRTWRDKHLR